MTVAWFRAWWWSPGPFDARMARFVVEYKVVGATYVFDLVGILEIMAAAEYYAGACMDMVPQHLLAPHMLYRAQTEQVGRREDDIGIEQGRIMWLPAFESLPERAVRRAHGKGAVEEGIYNHPVVVVSRPHDEEQSVHFHLVSYRRMSISCH